MFCPYCGTNLPDGARFCAGCGNKLELAQTASSASTPVQTAAYANPVPAAAKKRSKMPVIIIAVVAAVALIAAAVIFLFPMLSGGAGNNGCDELTLASGVAFYNGKLVSTDIRQELSVSLSGDCYMVRTDDNGYACIKDGKKLEITENFDLYQGGYYAIAASGSAVVYTTKIGGVELLDTNTGNVTVIESYGDFYGAVVSPDGKSVIYSDSRTAYLYHNGNKTKLLDTDQTGKVTTSVIAVSNNAEYIFLAASNRGKYMTLYCFDANGSIRYTSDEYEKTVVGYFTNNDNTQVGFKLYRQPELHVYDAKRGRMSYVSFEENVEVMPFAQCSYNAYHNAKDYAAMRMDVVYVYNFNTSDLLSTYYSKGARGGMPYVFKINGNKAELLDDNAAIVTEYTGDDLIYLNYKEKELIVLTSSGNKSDISDNVVAFGVSKDKSCVYYFTDDEELWLYSGGQNKKIANNVCVENYQQSFGYVGYGIPCIIGNGILYHDNDGNAYIYRNGSIEKQSHDMSFYTDQINLGEYSLLATFSVKETVYLRNYFPATDYLPCTKGSEAYIMTADGKLTELEIN